MMQGLDSKATHYVGGFFCAAGKFRINRHFRWLKRHGPWVKRQSKCHKRHFRWLATQFVGKKAIFSMENQVKTINSVAKKGHFHRPVTAKSHRINRKNSMKYQTKRQIRWKFL